MHHSKSIKAALIAGIATISIIFGLQTQNTSAVSATDFNAGNIISDAIFYNKDAMTLAEIEAFINSHTVSCDTWGTKAVGSGRYINGVAVPASTTRAAYADMMIAAGNSRYHKPPYICLTNYYENPTTHRTSFDSGAVKETGMLSAAEIIYKAAQTYNINPQVLLVTLKKEYSYVYTDDWPLRDQYNTVMGYGCPDSGPNNTANCSEKYYGFYNQVMNAAWQFNYYKENIKSYNYQPGRTNTIQYTTTTSCGSKQVYIENIATASLYIYTPYTPNAAALAAYPGTATCGSYGNRNFFMFFNEWFGSTQFTPTIVNPAPGDYYITLKSDYEKTIQLSTNSTTNGVSLVNGTRIENALDTFSLIKNSDNTYTIKNLSTNKVLDIPSANAVEGATIQQYDSNGTNAQKWYIYDNGNGSYSIASVVNGNLALAASSDGSLKLSAYTQNAAAQSFRFIAKTQPVADNTYLIRSNIRQNYTVDVYNANTANGTKTWMYDQNNTQAQIFQFDYNSKTGYYTITNPKSGRVLDVASAGTANGTSTQIYDDNSTCAQQWSIEKWSEGELEILSACSGKALDVASAATVAGTKLQIYDRNNTNAQKWHLESIELPTPPVADGLYTITSALKANYVLDVYNAGTKDGTNVWMYDKNGTAAQTFKLQYDYSSETYTITNPLSGKVLDVAAAGTKDGTNVNIWTSNGTCAQRWKITLVTSNQYELSSACSGKLLDVSAAGLAAGTNVHIWTKNNTLAQKWLLAPLN